MTWALLLNKTYEPLHFVPRRKVLKLLAKEKVDTFVNGDGVSSVWETCEVFTSSRSIKLPATLILRDRVNKRWKAPRFKRKALFNRDDWSCQYCGVALDRKAVTIDHVLPRAQGGTTTWTNCVTACRSCNKRKDDRTPEQANMRLLSQPTIPHALHFWDSHTRVTWHPDWRIFLDADVTNR